MQTDQPIAGDAGQAMSQLEVELQKMRRPSDSPLFAIREIMDKMWELQNKERVIVTAYPACNSAV
jgi:hypothetical protein